MTDTTATTDPAESLYQALDALYEAYCACQRHASQLDGHAFAKAFDAPARKAGEILRAHRGRYRRRRR